MRFYGGMKLTFKIADPSRHVVVYTLSGKKIADIPAITRTANLSYFMQRKWMKNGLYAVNFGGGQVDITSGKFVFSASEAYLIENGKVTQPVKGATLIGNGPEVLKHVSMLGNDLQLDPGVGTCGKEGQSVPVGVGQPTMLIDRLTVGGTSA